MTPKLYQHKPGDTFSYAGTCKLPAGTWSATCQFRGGLGLTQRALIAVVLGVPVDGVTPISLYASADDTLTWLPGVYELDIRFSDVGGAVVHSSTVLLPVVRAITLLV